MRALLPRVLLLWSLASCAAGLAAAAPKNASDLLAEARKLRDAGGDSRQEAVALCQTLISDRTVTDRDKVTAYEVAIDCYRRAKDYPKAIVLAERMRAAFADEVATVWKALYLEYGDYLRLNDKLDVIIARLQQFIRSHPAEDERNAQGYLWIADLESRRGRHAAAGEAAALAAKLAGDNMRLRYDATWRRQDAAYREKDYAKQAALLKEALTTDAQPPFDPGMVANFRRSYGDTLLRLEQYDAVREFFLPVIETEEEPADGQRWCFYVASAYEREEKYSQAREALEWVFIRFPQTTREWRQAQRRLADLWAREKRYPEALSAARLLYDSAHTQGELNSYAGLLNSLLRSADGNEERSRAFTLYELFGKAGQDGKLGTEDDCVDVLATIPYPPCAQRERAFAPQRAAAGDTAEALEYCAWTYVFTAQPQQALPYFVAAFRRSPPDKRAAMAETLAFAALRPAVGDPGKRSTVPRYVAFGPAGPDGQPGTEDDVLEPTGLGSLELPTPPTGTDDATPEEVDELVDRLWELTQDQRESRNRRAKAIDGLRRLYEALPDRDWAGLKAWARERLLEETDDQLETAAGLLAAALAHGDALHLGASRSFWTEVTAALGAQGRKLPYRLAHVRDDLERRARSLAKMTALPNLRPPKPPKKGK